jgi:hypothetical protein
MPEVIGDQEPTAADIFVSCSWPDPICVANMGGGLYGWKSVEQALKDAAFIATAREAVPALIARVRKLEGGMRDIDAMPYYTAPIPENYVDGLLARYTKALDIARRILKGSET